MVDISSSQLLFLIGIIVIIVTLCIAAMCAFWFYSKGKKIKKQLEKDYGKQIR